MAGRPASSPCYPSKPWAGPTSAATFRYISAGNLHHDDWVALIVMNYPARQRLKFYGHASVHGAGEAPELLQLTEAHYYALIERVVLVQVEAYDWNCQQDITPRYTREEIHQQTSAMRLAAVEAENTKLRHLLTTAREVR